MLCDTELKILPQASPDAKIGHSKWKNRYEQELQARLKARTKVSAENNPIDCIYVTTSECQEDGLNNPLKKRAGILIDGKIYWIKTCFSHIWELGNILDCLGVSVADNGEWGFWEGNRAPLKNFVAVLQKPYEEVFAKDSEYIVNAAVLEDGYPWWNVKDIKKTIFNPIEDKQIKDQ